MTEAERLVQAIQLEQAMSDRLCQESLYHFIKKFWPVIEPGTPFVDGWHIQAICLHLEAITRFEIANLLINIPPRHMKSIIVSVMWPAWVWLRHPERRFVFASYSQSLSMQDSVKCRDIIRSPDYRRIVNGKWDLKEDQDLKSEFINTEHGTRLATSVGGTLTGKGGDYLVGDDLINAEDAYSEPARDKAWRFWSQTMPTRANNPKRVGKVVIMQRLHEDDVAGRILKNDKDGTWNRLILSAQFDWKIAMKNLSALGWIDPRKTDGELLWPERFDIGAITNLTKELGSLASSGQLQQDPKPMDGGLFKRKWWKTHKLNPLNILEKVQFWDCAQKVGVSNDFSVCATWARTPQGYFLLDLWRKKVEAPELRRVVESLYDKHKPDAVVIEDKSSGSSLIQYLLLETALPVIPYDPGKADKVVRASAATPTVEAGRCSLYEKIEDIEEFISEHEKFPNATHDDTVDTTSMMVDYFSKRGSSQVRIRSL